MSKRLSYITVGSYPIHIAITDCRVSFKRELRRLKIEEEIEFTIRDCPATNHFMTNKTGGNAISIICVDRKKCARSTQIEIMGLIVHEVVHAWQGTLKLIGEKNPGEEIEAYTIQDWSIQCMNLYNRGFKK